MAKTTHIGTCQVCGRSQKLPNGLLSKHGYTVEWGFFSGECYGTGNLPFEISENLIDGSIQSATDERNSVIRLSDEYKSGRLDADLKAWNHSHYESDGYGRDRFRGGYVWEQATVVPVTEGMRGKFMYVDAKGKKVNIDVYDYEIETLDQTRVYMNKQYAEGFLDKRVENLSRYIEWQQKRIENWEPTELTPV